MAAKRVLWEIGKSRLQEAGLNVEREKYRLAVRKAGRNVFPDYVSITQGKVSELRVNQLIKKYTAEPSG